MLENKNTFKALLGLIMCLLVFSACKKDNESEPSSKPNPSALDVSEGAPGDVITVQGTGLAGIKSIVFEEKAVPAAFNPSFNNDGAIIFRVPDTAYAGEQNIIFTNRLDVQFTIPFKVTPLAAVSSASNYNFVPAETNIDLIGNNLDEVERVVISGSELEVEIIAKEKRKLTLKFPETTQTIVKLDIINNAGTITTSQSFVNITKTFQLFTDAYAPTFEDASWGDAGKIITTDVKSGKTALSKKYDAGQWHLMGIGWTNIEQSSNFQFLSFYVKGGTKDYNLYIQTSQSESGWDTFNDYNKIFVPKGVWSYFRIPVSDLKLWANGSAFNQLAWRIQGPDGSDETFVFDDIIFIK